MPFFTIVMIILAVCSFLALLAAVWLVFVFSSSDAPAQPCKIRDGIAGSSHHTNDGARGGGS